MPITLLAKAPLVEHIQLVTDTDSAFRCFTGHFCHTTYWGIFPRGLLLATPALW